MSAQPQFDESARADQTPDPDNAGAGAGQPPGRKPMVRHPIVAAVMSASLPGLGQLYNGQLNRAAWLFLAFCMLAAPMTAFIALVLPAGLTAQVLLAFLTATIALWAWNVYDAWNTARQNTQVSRDWQVSGVYFAVFLLCAGLVLPTVIHQVRTQLVQPVHIVGNSMSPALLNNDHVFINRRVNCLGCSRRVEHGDILLFTYPNDRTKCHIKRLLALPGDRVRIDASGVYVNEQPVERYQGGQLPDAEPVDMILPTSHIFVIGDNLQDSRDSRHFGPVDMRDIRGVARQIYYSSGDQGIRWNRIGQLVQ